jgi:hypothetical protein
MEEEKARQFEKTGAHQVEEGPSKRCANPSKETAVFSLLILAFVNLWV